MESIRKLNNFNFQYNAKIISSILHWFFTLFEGYKCNKLYEITQKQRVLWEPEKINFKSFKFHKMKSY